jgi:hypothetical protein
MLLQLMQENEAKNKLYQADMHCYLRKNQRWDKKHFKVDKNF